MSPRISSFFDIVSLLEVFPSWFGRWPKSPARPQTQQPGLRGRAVDIRSCSLLAGRRLCGPAGGGLLVVEVLDHISVELVDLLALDLHGRRDLLFFLEEVTLEDPELLDPLNLGQALVQLVDRTLDLLDGALVVGDLGDAALDPLLLRPGRRRL